MNENVFDAQGMTQSQRMIHTPSGFARRNLSFVQEIGTLQSLKAHSCIRENLDSYLFFLVLEGCGTVATGGKIYDVKKGDCVFLDCRKHYEHTSSEENPWKITWVHFNGSEVNACFPFFEEGNKSCPVFRPADCTLYTELLERLKELLPVKAVMAELESSHILSRLLLECLKSVVSNEELRMDTDVTELEADDYTALREAVNEHFEEEGLERLLSIQFGMEAEQLNEIFCRKFGIGIREYIENRKFNKAKELLRFTIKPVDEIMMESGIKDRQTLEALFMENEDMSPEEYRKKWAQWIKS